jgi:beta-lactamase class D
MNKRKGFIIAIMEFAMNSFAIQPTEIPGLKKIFDKYQIEGSILIYNQNDNCYSGYHLERCNIAFCPASTFKIPNTLIALESGVATTETIFK